MSEKYLPIKIFEKRKDYDERSTEGGGSDREPLFVLHGEALQKHAQVLTEDLEKVRSQIHRAVEKKRVLPVIMATSLDESAIAKTYRSRVADILNSDGNDNVVGVYGDRQILSVLSSEAVLDNLERSIGKEEEAVLTSSLTKVETFQPKMDVFVSECVNYRVRLFDYDDFDRNNLERILFEDFCDDIGVRIQKRIRFTADMFIYRVTVDSLEEYTRLGEFEGLYSVEGTSPVEMGEDILSGGLEVPVRYPQEDGYYQTVGVLDTGIAAIGHLSPWLLENEHTNYPEEYADRRHGTAVAGIIEYSDDLNGRCSERMALPAH